MAKLYGNPKATVIYAVLMIHFDKITEFIHLRNLKQNNLITYISLKKLMEFYKSVIIKMR